MKPFAKVLVWVTPLLLTSCGAPPPPPQSPPPAPLDASGGRETCPLGVKNAHAQYDDTATGGKLTFSTTPEHLAELRARAHDASAMHGNGQHVGHGHDGKHEMGGRKHGVQPMYMPPSHAGVEDTPDGARIVFTPDNPDDLSKLREKLKLRAEKMMTTCE